MYRNRNISQNTVGILRYSCGFLFSAFLFCYLAFIRGEVLAEIQFELSKGVTHYSILAGAIIITVFLQIVQVVVSRVIHMPDKYYYLTYVPSFIALYMIINIDGNVGGELVWGVWKWLLPLLLLAWGATVLAITRAEPDVYGTKPTIQAMLWPNYLCMLAMICICGFLSNTPSQLQYELKVERLLEQKEYESASEVATSSLEATSRLTQLRMYALSKQGLLGENIFRYPQYFGVNGLFDIKDTVKSHRFPIDRIFIHLGALPGKSIKSNFRYIDLLAHNDSISTEQSRQYLLCYHLLNKKLGAFNSDLTYVYGDTIVNELPRAYQEAVIMQNEYTQDSLPLFINKDYVERYAKYKSMKKSISDATERKNRTRREFGDTYWWYYDY